MNARQYEALAYLKANPKIPASDFSALFHPDLIDSILHSHWIKLVGSRMVNGTNNYKDAHYIITQDGYTAMEEYEASQRSEQREDESLHVAKRANHIAIGAAIAAGAALLFQVAEWITSVIQQFAG